MSRNQYFFAALAVVGVFCSPAYAASDPSAKSDRDSDSVVRQIGEINLSIDLIKKKMEHRQLLEQQSMIGEDAGPVDVPRIVEVFQRPDSPIMARLIYPSGDTVIAREGQDIGKGMTVTTITLRGVSVKRKGKVITLDFAVNSLPPSSPTPGVPASLQNFGR